MPENVTAARPDGFDYEKDGTITVHIDGERRHLRRPRTGEYKRFLLASRARDDELTELRQAATTETTAPDGKGLEGLSEEAAAALIDRARDLNRAIGDRQGELDRRWFGLVFNGDGEQPGLSDTKLPEDADEWPVWLWQADNLVKFIEHWRAVPLARGS